MTSGGSAHESARLIPPGLRALLETRFPGARVLEARSLAPDASPAHDGTAKHAGYGQPLRITLHTTDGAAETVVFHTASANDFGHDRRADRAAELLLAWDTFGDLPSHVRALDVGAIGDDGRLISLGEAGELYLLTGFAPGNVYADDLRRIADGHVAERRDLERVDALAHYLAALHGEHGGRPAIYRRAVRDLVGHGEGLFGMIDGYPDDTPGAPPERLRAIERRAVEWRWRLRGREERLARIHGDFHPFNTVFDDAGRLTLLDAARGSRGEPADDVTAMAVNFVFFALESPGAWPRGLGRLWHRFWTRYLDESGDRALLDVAAPWFAWRALVVCSPAFYPKLTAVARDRLLGLAERMMDAPRFEPAAADRLFE